MIYSLLDEKNLLRQGRDDAPEKWAEEFAGLLEQRKPMLHAGRYAALDLHKWFHGDIFWGTNAERSAPGVPGRGRTRGKLHAMG